MGGNDTNNYIDSSNSYQYSNAILSSDEQSGYPVWAQAVPVPIPVPLLAILLVLAYCSNLKQRIKARRDTSSASSV